MACLVAASANAALSVSGSVGGAPTGVSRVNFDDLALGSGGGTASGPNGSVAVSFVVDGQAVAGAMSGQYAAPFLSGGNGTGFGSPDQANGVDGTTYLTSGISSGSTQGKAILTFGAPEMYMGLLWGSVDDYNTLSFYDANDVLIGSVTGLDVTGSPNGDQGVNGTLYVNINSDLAFTKVVATSTKYAFEFDNVAYNETNVVVPEPSTILAGVLLLLPMGLYGVRNFRNRQPAV
jgi:hypothetical protein